MREIKFRAWDNDYQMIIYPKAYYVEKGEFNSKETINNAWNDYNIGELYNPEENEYHTIYLFDNRFIIMQYTGLKDKNQKEVYDGDIAKNNYYKDSLLVFSWDADLLTYKATVVSDGIYCEDVFFIASDGKKYEVIGNKFENPELLNN